MGVRMTEARDVIAQELHPVACSGCRMCRAYAEKILSALDAAGFAIVPKVATDEMMRAYYSCMEGTHPTARMNPDKYLTHNLKAGKRWAAMLKASKEAVPGGTACQSSEQAMHETTSNDAQRD